jgi:hypothetical protein
VVGAAPRGLFAALGLSRRGREVLVVGDSHLVRGCGWILAPGVAMDVVGAVCTGGAMVAVVADSVALPSRERALCLQSGKRLGGDSR